MKKNKKVFNPITGKYMSVTDKLVLALLIKQAPGLIDYWKGASVDVPFHEFISNYENAVPVKGALNKLIAKKYSGVVNGLIAIWQNEHLEEYSTFDMYLESCHTRAMQVSNKHK